MRTTAPSEGRDRIAEVRRLTGFSPSMPRSDETGGVLAAPARHEAGYRLSSDRDLERLLVDEIGCCPFFSFTTTVGRGAVALEATAPVGAQALVAAVLGAAA